MNDAVIIAILIIAAFFLLFIFIFYTIVIIDRIMRRIAYKKMMARSATGRATPSEGEG